MVMVHTDRWFKKESGKWHQGFSLDKRLKENIDQYLIKAVKSKWDGVVLVTGMEGSAKSSICQQLAYYVDPTFAKVVDYKGKKAVVPKDESVDRIVFTQEQFMKAVDTAKPGQAIIWDEFVMGGLSTEALGKQQNELIKYMTTIRKKRLFIFMIIPSIFMLRLYFILRTRFLIHCYSPDGIQRGHFKFYSYDRKRDLFVKGRKYFSMKVSKPNFSGTFVDTTGWFVNMDMYENKKDETIKSIGQEEEKKKEEGGKRLQEWKNKSNLAWAVFYAHVNRQLRLAGEKEIAVNKFYYEIMEPMIKDFMSYNTTVRAIKDGTKYAKEETYPVYLDLEPDHK